MKHLLFITLLLTTVACQQEELGGGGCTDQAPAATPTEIKLTHRNLSGCEGDSCYYDLYNMTQKYGCGLSLSFGNDWGENEFTTVHVVDQQAQIVDLGEGPCQNVEGSNQHSRTEDPWGWLNNGQAWGTLNSEGVEDIPALKNHCYLMHKSSSRHEVVVMFHVKDHVKNQYVTIDEIEVFKRSRLK